MPKKSAIASKAAASPASKKSRPSPSSASQGNKKRARFEGPAAPQPQAKKVARSTPKSLKPVKVVPTPAAPRTFIVTAGSYERLLYGASCTLVPSTTSAFDLPYELSVTPIFSFPAHLSSLRSVSASLLASPGTGSERKVGGKYLVSGGTDEVIKVWDLKRKKEVGSLEGEAAGTITCLRFVAQRNMLLAASSDSAITMYRVRDWVLLRSVKGHKGRVNSIDAHPAGRVALSVGQDKMLRMWDLVAGKAVATMKVGEEGDVVRWNTDGTKFAVICASTVTVYGIDMAVHHTFTAPSRFHDVRFCYFPIDATDPSQCEYLFVACEDGKTRVFDITTKSAPPADGEGTPLEALAQLSAHANRVKMLDLLEVATPDDTPTDPSSTIILSSISSDGKIHLYDLAVLAKLAGGKHIPGTDPVDVPPSATYDTDGSRLTCVCVIGMAEQVAKVEKGGESESDEESDEEIAFDSEEEIAFDSEEELEMEEEDEDEEEDEEEEEEE